MKNDLEIPVLLRKIAEDNDQKAFAVFFRLYYSRLVQFAFQLVNSYKTAEDVVSDVMIRMLNNREEVFKKENFIGYLFTSVKNEAINQNKKQSHPFNQKSELSISDRFGADLYDPHEVYLENELHRLVNMVIENMPPKRKLVYKLVKDEGLKYKEIGVLMDITEKTVEKHMEVAVKQLREEVTKYLLDYSKDSNFVTVPLTNLLSLLIIHIL